MIRRLFSSQLRINMVSGVVATVVNVVVLAIAYPVYLHFLGYETYGVWLILATVLTFAQLGNLGISSAIMKLVAEEHGRGNTKGIQSYVTTSLGILLVTGSLALILILLFQNQIISAFKLSGQNAVIASQFLPYIAFLSVCVMLVQVLNSTISGLGRMDIANYILSGGRVVTVGVSLILLWLGNGIESLLIGNVLSWIFVGGTSVLVIRKTANIRLLRLGNLDKQRYKRLLRFGAGIFGGSVISMFLSPFNKLMLSRYAGVSTIPVYEIAFAGSMQVRALIEAGLRALMPEISRIGANMTKYAKDRISQIYHRAMRLIFLFGIPMYGTLVIFSPLMLRVWLGDRFVETLPGDFRIMLIGSSFLSLLGVPAFYTIIGLDRVRYLVTSSIIAASCNCATVIIHCALMGHLSVRSIGLYMAMSFAAGTAYLICKVRHLFTGDNVRKG